MRWMHAGIQEIHLITFDHSGQVSTLLLLAVGEVEYQ